MIAQERAKREAKRALRELDTRRARHAQCEADARAYFNDPSITVRDKIGAGRRFLRYFNGMGDPALMPLAAMAVAKEYILQHRSLDDTEIRKAIGKKPMAKVVWAKEGF